MLRRLPFLLVCVVGCGGGDEIRTYSQPKPVGGGGSDTKVTAEPAVETRILGAILPADKPEWFFKLMGPASQIEPHAADFEKLVRTIKLNPGAIPGYELPTGWATGPAKPDKMAQGTITVGGLEVTITQAGGDPAGNVARWAGQVGLSVAPADIAKYTRTVETAGGVKALFADLKGTKADGGRPPMMGGMGLPPNHPPANAPAPTAPAVPGTEYRILGAMLPADKPEWFFKITGPATTIDAVAADFDKFILSMKLTANGPPTYEMPAGWSPGPPKNDGITTATIRVPGELTLTVTRAGGDPAGNVQRWAGQVGATEAGKSTRTLDTAGGTKALIADVRGPNNPTGGRMIGR